MPTSCVPKWLGTPCENCVHTLQYENNDQDKTDKRFLFHFSKKLTFCLTLLLCIRTLVPTHSNSTTGADCPPSKIQYPFIKASHSQYFMYETLTWLNIELHRNVYRIILKISNRHIKWVMCDSVLIRVLLLYWWICKLFVSERWLHCPRSWNNP